MNKKNASLEALLNESDAPVIPVKKVGAPPARSKGEEPEVKRGRGRPKKVEGKRQQVPVYLPEAVYFELLDWVSMKKRDDRQFSMNDLVLEALEVWLEKNGRPSIQRLIDKLK